ncbi:hypothetical protein [Parafrankia sp. EUN1f]|uniref:hypothetical protein n=1 Tax=Parafrankia sp. EUN1f TaxID=102897 RepID=UPI0001C463E1|nr:hypothetical protein [Parafrankia sp. EUN1f]EFC81176.1 hypothetical protein FrEUN1fDRAFT_5705 [Parafrankia sp. EUN1f]
MLEVDVGNALKLVRKSSPVDFGVLSVASVEDARESLSIVAVSLESDFADVLVEDEALVSLRDALSEVYEARNREEARRARDARRQPRS